MREQRKGEHIMGKIVQSSIDVMQGVPEEVVARVCEGRKGREIDFSDIPEQDVSQFVHWSVHHPRKEESVSVNITLDPATARILNAKAQAARQTPSELAAAMVHRALAPA
jgi:hypothetical protein